MFDLIFPFLLISTEKSSFQFSNFCCSNYPRTPVKTLALAGSMRQKYPVPPILMCSSSLYYQYIHIYNINVLNVLHILIYNFSNLLQSPKYIFMGRDVKLNCCGLIFTRQILNVKMQTILSAQRIPVFSSLSAVSSLNDWYK